MISWTLLSTHLLGGTLYLDPGSGSFLIQLLIGALMGGALAIKIYWRKIVSFFKKDKPETNPEDEEN